VDELLHPDAPGCPDSTKARAADAVRAPRRWSAQVGAGQRHRVVIAKPLSMIPKPMARFQAPMPGIGYSVWLR